MSAIADHSCSKRTSLMCHLPAYTPRSTPVRDASAPRGLSGMEVRLAQASHHTTSHQPDQPRPTHDRTSRTGRHAGHGRIIWPAAPTVIDPRRFPDTAATIAQLFARAHVVLAALKGHGKGSPL